MTRTTMVCQVLLAAALALAVPVHADDFPSKSLRLIIPNPPGGGTDILGRFVADRLQGKIGQSVIVENRAGAGGNIAAESVFKAAPDGYTLLLGHHGQLVLSKMLYAKLAYDPELFAPISLVATITNVLIVHPNMTAGNVPQLIALAKAKPGQLNYSSSLNGPSHLTAEMFNSMAGVKVVGIQYQGNGPAAMAVLAGQVDLMFVELGITLPHVRAGKLRALAVASAKRTPLLPDVPTVSETLPGFASSSMYGLVAPPKTPGQIADRLSAAVAEILKQPDNTKRLLEMSFEAVGSTPAELAQFLRDETKRWGEVVRVSGAKAQ